MIKFNGLIYKAGLFCLGLLLFISCKEDEISISIPVPTAPAPAPPDRNENSVKSLFSNTYTNAPVDSWNSPRASSTAEVSFIQIADNDVIQYRTFNFANVEFSSAPINATDMETMHMDIWTPDPISEESMFKVLLIDFGANGTFDGGDDSSHEVTVNSIALSSGNWISLDIPLANFTGLSSRENLAQMVISATFPNLYIDNVYFYGEEIAPPPLGEPTVAAPTPTVSSEEVLSVFSDAYTDVTGTNFNPNWGQSGFTTAGQITIGTDNILSYPNFNYQGIDIAGEGNNVDVSGYSDLHLDYFSTDATTLRIFLISPGAGNEVSYDLTVPTTGWSSIDIPLSAFPAPVNLAEVTQFKFDGGGGSQSIYLDNIYFFGTAGGGGGNDNCPAPPAGDFILDGGFEANAGCWELIENQGNVSTTIVSNESNGGTNSARIETAPAGNPGIKQTRFGAGQIQPNTTYVVTFDIRQDEADPVANGAVLKVATFSEGAEGSGVGAIRHELIGAEGSVPSAWTPRTLTFTTADVGNIEGGVSLLIELVGGGEPTTGTIFIDNVTFRAQ